MKPKFHCTIVILIFGVLISSMFISGTSSTTVQTRITDISFDYGIIPVDPSNCGIIPFNYTECSIFRFDLSYEIWNPSPHNITYSDIYNKINIWGDVHLINLTLGSTIYSFIEGLGSGIPMMSPITLYPGLNSGTVGLQISMARYNSTSLPNGYYSIFAEVPNYTDQINHLSYIIAENTSIQFSYSKIPDNWGEFETIDPSATTSQTSNISNPSNSTNDDVFFTPLSIFILTLLLVEKLKIMKWKELF